MQLILLFSENYFLLSVRLACVLLSRRVCATVPELKLTTDHLFVFCVIKITWLLFQFYFLMLCLNLVATSNNLGADRQ